MEDVDSPMLDQPHDLPSSPELKSSKSAIRPPVEPSTVLIDKATLSPKITAGPTLEQNMAFAALREPQPQPRSSTVSSETSPFLDGKATKGEKRAVEAPVDNLRPRVRLRIDEDPG